MLNFFFKPWSPFRSFKNKAEGLHAASKDAKQDPAIGKPKDITNEIFERNLQIHWNLKKFVF